MAVRTALSRHGYSTMCQDDDIRRRLLKFRPATSRHHRRRLQRLEVSTAGVVDGLVESAQHSRRPLLSQGTRSRTPSAGAIFSPVEFLPFPSLFGISEDSYYTARHASFLRPAPAPSRRHRRLAGCPAEAPPRQLPPLQTSSPQGGRRLLISRPPLHVGNRLRPRLSTAPDAPPSGRRCLAVYQVEQMLLELGCRVVAAATAVPPFLACCSFGYGVEEVV
ncbi:hypothetical protein SASPL_131153 [Salvia splendens]|uniref:Uncharacterized protein n=1 Tax=Salvia splendens TaxID=180675 RepID=A0A8X8X5F9_SALSN|nr:hypothetical protein SASPL_131153 [Salvia splendens]